MKVKAFFKKHLFDLITGIVLVAITLGVLLYFVWPRNSDNLRATIYHKNETVQEIALFSIEEGVVEEYLIEGSNGEMKVEAKHNAIRIAESSCPSQYCVNQGWISTPSMTLICAHNEVFITLSGDSNEVII